MIKSRVIKAYMYAEEKHSGQKRKYSGLDYFVHPKGTARKLEDLTHDEDIVIAGFLHDVVEDCCVSICDIEKIFGHRVSSLVYEVTTIMEDNETKIEALCRKVIEMSDDALTLKLADRLDNVEYLNTDCKTSEERQFIKKYYDETKKYLGYIETNRGNRKKVHNLLIRMIRCKLDYIQMKFLWG